VSRSTRRWPAGLPTAVVLPKNRTALPAEFAGDDVRYTERLVELFVDALTQPGDDVLDPFCGFGTTVVTAEAMGRRGWGIEVDPARAAYVRRLVRHPERVVTADARDLEALALPPPSLLITSPPFSSPGEPRDALTAYAAPNRGYPGYLGELARLFADARTLMGGDGWIVVEASNIRHEDGRVTTLAWDLAGAIGHVACFMGEMTVRWEPTYGHGYDHSYCLVFSCA
jgi:DNA methylase